MDARGKYVGNFAEEILKEIETKEKNKVKTRKQEFKDLDKEIDSFLNFNQFEVNKQMNDAFEGKKDWREAYDQQIMK